MSNIAHSRSSGHSKEIAPILRAVFFAFVFLVVSVVSTAMPDQAEVSFQLRSTGNAQGELFYAQGSGGYDPAQRLSFSIIPDGQWHEYRVDLPAGVQPSAIRLDLGIRPGKAALRELRVSLGRARHQPNGPSLVAAVNAQNDLELSVRDDELDFVLTGADPYIGFNLPSFGSQAFLSRLASSVSPALAVGGLWLFAELLLAAVMRHAGVRNHDFRRRLLERCADRISDPRVLVVTPSVLAVVLAIAVFSAAYVGLNLNQSSVGVWNGIFGKPAETGAVFGTPKPIRSDEWNVQTPWLLNQAANGFPVENDNIGGAKAPMLAGVPVSGTILAANPKYLGFFVFDDPARGLSWMWAFKSASLFGAFLWLFLILTRGDLAVSLAGALWVSGTSFVQWWFSSGLPDILTGFAVCCLGAIYLLFGARRSSVVLGAVLGAIGVCLLVSTLYPPFIVPLAYLGFAVVVGFGTAIAGWKGVWKTLPITRLVGALATIAVLTLGIAMYLSTSAETVEIMLSTVYPGHRTASPGEMSLSQLAMGWFEYLRVGQDRYPAGAPNASEASSFSMLAPFVLMLLPVAIYARREFAVITALGLYLLLMGAWVVIDLPSGLATVMQAAGLGYSPPVRALVGVGMASILLCVVVAASVRARRLPLLGLRSRFVLVGLAALVVAGLGAYFRHADPGFFSIAVIAVGTLAVLLILFGVAFGRGSIMLAGLVLTVTPAFTVNPVSLGADALTRKPILMDAAAASVAGDKWVTIEDFVLSQGLKAHGLEVLNGAQMIPALDRVRLLDPDDEYEGIWNRYANVIVSSAPGLSEPEFLLHTPDLYAIRLDVCSGALFGIGVTRVAYISHVPSPDLQCLDEIEVEVEDSEVRIFRLLPPTL